ncbi:MULTISPECIES: 23S rRNA accumulation protein YceD [Idiomarina]|uniref:23S rRNA accumulation protein YceD n=1 Tax=Idiomarinaceae TaxID=267893 RepID=UPI00129B9A70|nr:MULTISPECIES: 23S rRNA accumulation protein YceD [Idiomarina]MRJ40925.1 23S rRNA accumulation protein YceD [Idiomarina sp. FeN1]NCU56729.1 23S rRNA accumulation protein YceD [Idiomarina sp. FenA--70]NCU59109.1 23S rRNA accumulation protein YceD [Idiomarina sp. FenBw--71]UUN14400.1 23S rRNA accumulation protein YceD [Idiomarina loihiensis]
MQKVRVPITVDPVKSAGKQVSYIGLVPGKSLARLQELLLEPMSDVDVSLSFDTDAQGIKRLTGHAEVTVCVACERCSDAMQWPISCDFVYAPITKRQKATEMPEEYEPIELDELGEINLHALVEDELMLALPVVIKHDERECRVDSKAMQWGKIDDAPAAKDNPFAVLQELKRK